MATTVVPVKSAWTSKINWGAAAAFVLMALTFFGIDVDADTKAAIEAVIGGIFTIYAWIMRTWFTTAMTAASMRISTPKEGDDDNEQY